MPESKAQDDIDKEAFEQWKLRWNKNYTTSKEEKIRFEKFQKNLCLEEANSGNSGPSEPPWMALDTHADSIPFEQYKVEILGLEPDNPEERVFSDSDSEEREIFKKGYGKAHYGVKDKDGKVQLKFIYTKNLRDLSDRDSWYLPPVDNGQKLMTLYTKNLKGPFPWCVPPVDKGQSDHEIDDTKEEEHVTAKRQSGRKKDDTKHVTAKRQSDHENDDTKRHKSGCGGGEDAAMTVEPEPENEVVLL